MSYFLLRLQCVNTLKPRRNRRHFADDIFKCVFLNENVLISVKLSLKFIPMGPVNNIPSLVQMMAWCRLGVKPLSEAMMISLPRLQCVNVGPVHLGSPYLSQGLSAPSQGCGRLNHLLGDASRAR